MPEKGQETKHPNKNKYQKQTKVFVKNDLVFKSYDLKDDKLMHQFQSDSRPNIEKSDVIKKFT